LFCVDAPDSDDSEETLLFLHTVVASWSFQYVSGSNQVSAIALRNSQCDVLAADVQNTYLNMPTKEKCFTIAGPKFGPDNVGKPVLIVRALYGLQSLGVR
jgi:hypothetical protein